MQPRCRGGRFKAGIVPKPTPPGLAPKTVRNIHALIHRALVDAVAWKYINDNPASHVKPPKRARTRRQVWCTEEIQTFLASVRQDRFAALFLLELTAGIRRGQVCGLRWQSVDLDAGEITVHDNRVVMGGRARDKAGGKTKNADQTIAIDHATLAALRSWREIQDSEREFYGTDYLSGDYVFTFENGRPPHPDTIRKRFGFFLQTYAHVLKNDDREAAEQAASFLLGSAWDEGSQDGQQA